MKRSIYIVVLLFCMTSLVYAQKEKNIWHFGILAGLDFNKKTTLSLTDALTGTVVTMNDMPEAIVSPINTTEGCFTLSSSAGDLLMSSDGITVYKKDYMDYMPSPPAVNSQMIMQNGTGLLGNPSATQSGIVVPMPGKQNMFYIITVAIGSIGGSGNANGIRYSVVNMDSNDGLGEVTAEKNVALKAGNSYENIAVVANADESGYWLVHRDRKQLYVWAITENGFSEPTIYPFPGLSSNTTNLSYIGSTFFSYDGKYVVCANFDHQVLIAKFDPATGVVDTSSAVIRNLSQQIYGGAFTATNEYVYIAGMVNGNNTNGTVYRAKVSDLMAGGNFVELGSFNTGENICNLQLDPSNNRLLGIENRTRHLYVIEDLDGTQPVFHKFENYLLPNTLATLGLPTFAASYFVGKLNLKDFSCTAHSSTYSIEVDIIGKDVPVSLEWDFGDGSSTIPQNIVSGIKQYKQNHIYSQAGVYNITIIPIKADGTRMSAITMPANIINCTLKSNRMIRTDLLNAKEILNP